MTDDATYRKMKQERDRSEAECERLLTALRDTVTVRDYFAGRALVGLMGRSWADPVTGETPGNVHELWAIGAYKTADAMLAARGKP